MSSYQIITIVLSTFCAGLTFLLIRSEVEKRARKKYEGERVIKKTPELAQRISDLEKDMRKHDNRIYTLEQHMESSENTMRKVVESVNLLCRAMSGVIYGLVHGNENKEALLKIKEELDSGMKQI